jgi:hypothetical protein
MEKRAEFQRRATFDLTQNRRRIAGSKIDAIIARYRSDTKTTLKGKSRGKCAGMGNRAGGCARGAP